MGGVLIYICKLTVNSEIQDIYRYFARATCESACAVKIFILFFILLLNTSFNYFFFTRFFGYRIDYNSKI